ncbi:hypothetical protein FVEN_g12779 [Fusarium venenatum]|nr:hypothetical protein FVEN_g12779 [Fusarium venenatum]
MPPQTRSDTGSLMMKHPPVLSLSNPEYHYRLLSIYTEVGGEMPTSLDPPGHAPNHFNTSDPSDP